MVAVEEYTASISDCEVQMSLNGCSLLCQTWERMAYPPSFLRASSSGPVKKRNSALSVLRSHIPPAECKLIERRMGDMSRK